MDSPLDLTSANPMLNLYEEAWPIHTHMDSLPPGGVTLITKPMIERL